MPEGVKSLSPLQSNALDAVMLNVSQYAIGIVAQQPLGIGSGTLVKLENRIFILSAKHVFDVAQDSGIVRVDPREAGYLFRPRDINLVGLEGSTPTGPGRQVPVYRLPIAAVFDCLTEDLIAIELEQGTDTRFELEVFSVDGRLKTPAPQALINYTGYPFDLTLGLGTPGGRIVMNAEWGNIEDTVAVKEPLRGFNPDCHFIVPYPAAQEGREPHGFSGSAVWWHEKPSAVWYPNPFLAGVVVEYFRNPPRLKCIRANVVEEFLADVRAM